MKFKAMMAAAVVATMAAAASAAQYEIDASHSEVGFKVRHMMVGRTAGRFGRFSGTFVFDGQDPKSWSTRAKIEVASIDTKEEKRDAHLRNADFFDAEKFPSIEFLSTGLKGWKDGRGVLRGTLTMHGVTRPVELALESNGEAVDAWGATRAGFTARGTIDRRDYGIVWNKTLDKGGLAVGNEVEIVLEIEGVKKAS